MTQLLIQGEVILAQGPFVDDGENIRSYTADGKADAVFPKHAIEGWQIVEAVIPNGFDCSRYAWNGESVVEKPPVVVPQATMVRRITKLAFRNRFTMAEKVALELASMDDPAAPMADRQRAAAIRVQLADTAAASFIDLDRPDTRAGVQMLESTGLLAAGRAVAILDAPIADNERPA